MNKLNLFEPAYFFPYCAIAARYGDNYADADTKVPFIEGTVQKWLPGALVTRMPITSKLDFSFSIEHENKLLIVNLGTEGGLFDPGWVSDFSPQLERKEAWEAGGHLDFINAGETAAKLFAGKIGAYHDALYIVGHSRNRSVPMARWILREMGVMPRRVIPYCAPPVFTPKAADEYDKSGLGAVTIRPTMSNDLVDNIPFFKHVGVELKLPRVNSEAIQQRGIVGKIAYGHAYSSVFEALIKYCEEHHLGPEAKWLNDTKWVATV